MVHLRRPAHAGRHARVGGTAGMSPEPEAQAGGVLGHGDRAGGLRPRRPAPRFSTRTGSTSRCSTRPCSSASPGSDHDAATALPCVQRLAVGARERERGGRLFGVAIDAATERVCEAAEEIRRVAGKPGIVGVMLRPNPTEDWKPFHHESTTRSGALSDTGLPAGFPHVVAEPPGACGIMRIHPTRRRQLCRRTQGWTSTQRPPSCRRSPTRST